MTATFTQMGGMRIGPPVRLNETMMKNETILVGQIGIKFQLEAADTNGLVAMFEFTVPVGAKVPQPHYHKQYDEIIYGVEGVITFTVEGKALALVTPALIGPDYFKEMAAIVNAGGPPDVEKLKAVMLKHGLVPVMPQAAPR